MEIEKPRIGEPCNGCGICCRLQVCRNGAYILKLVDKLGDTVPGPCPALTLDNGQYKCGVVLFPKKYIKSPVSAEKLREAFKTVIGSGDGCDEPGENPTEEEDKKLDELVEKWKNDPQFIIKARAAMNILYNI